MRRRSVGRLVCVVLALGAPAWAERPFPILFVTQTPQPADFGTSIQAGAAEPTSPPEALRALLQWWKGVLFVDGFDLDGLAPWSAAVP